MANEGDTQKRKRRIGTRQKKAETPKGEKRDNMIQYRCRDWRHPIWFVFPTSTPAPTPTLTSTRPVELDWLVAVPKFVSRYLGLDFDDRSAHDLVIMIDHTRRIQYFVVEYCMMYITGSRSRSSSSTIDFSWFDVQVHVDVVHVVHVDVVSSTSFHVR